MAGDLCSLPRRAGDRQERDAGVSLINRQQNPRLKRRLVLPERGNGEMGQVVG